MTHFERVRTKHGIAMALAPSLQRYDFSDPETAKKWAEITYKSAEAFLAVIEPEMDKANLKDEEDRLKAIEASKAEWEAKNPPAQAPQTNAVKAAVEEIQANGGETT